jgi:hypothetical protein
MNLSPSWNPRWGKVANRVCESQYCSSFTPKLYATPLRLVCQGSVATSAMGCQ